MTTIVSDQFFTLSTSNIKAMLPTAKRKKYFESLYYILDVSLMSLFNFDIWSMLFGLKTKRYGWKITLVLLKYF